MKRLSKLLPAGMLFLLLVSLMPGPVKAKNTADSVSAAMANFFDSIVPPNMQQAHSPGVVVAVVNDSGLLFEKGYGMADFQGKRAVDPQRTVWRMASISKVVTATAVMQLVEQGKLDLDRDVNDYLKAFKIPEKFGKPVTLRNLLTHTAGFDDRYISKSFRTKEALPPLQDFLKKMLPKRLFPPGEAFVYSNFGNALAALVVQDVSGEDFNEYCRRHIFLPLGMKETSFRLDKYRSENLYQGYLYQEGNFRPVPFDYLGDYPAGQLLTTTAEFSRFMMCQLNEGTLDGVRILQPETADMMQTTQFTPNPKLIGSIGLAYNLFDVDGNKVVAHDGGYLGIATRMWLLPGRKTGIFMATNVMNMAAIQNVSYAFVKRFFDHTQPSEVKYPLDSLPAYDPHVTKYTGYYRLARYAHSDITKAGLLANYGVELSLWKNDKGMLMMNNLYGQPRRMIQVQPGVFRSVDDDYYMAFKLSKTGKPEFLFTNGTAAFEKVPAFYSLGKQRIMLICLLLFFVLMLIFRLFYLLVLKKKPVPELNRKIRKTSTWTAGLFMFHWLGLGLVFFVLHPAYEVFAIGLAYGVGPALYVVQAIPLIAMITLIFTVIYYVRILMKRDASWKIRLFYAVFILSAFLYLWLLNYWNLLGFRF